MKNGCCVYDDQTNKLLIIGGWDERDTKDSVLTYNPETDLCDFSGIRLPKPVEGHSICKKGDQIFVFGGFDSYGVTDRIMRIDLETRQAHVLDAKLT